MTPTALLPTWWDLVSPWRMNVEANPASKRTFSDASLSPSSPNLTQQHKKVNMSIDLDSLIDYRWTMSKCSYKNNIFRSQNWVNLSLIRCHQNWISCPRPKNRSPTKWSESIEKTNLELGSWERSWKWTSHPGVGWTRTIFKEKQFTNLFSNSRASWRGLNWVGPWACQNPRCRFNTSGHWSFT